MRDRIYVMDHGCLLAGIDDYQGRAMEERRLGVLLQDMAWDLLGVPESDDGSRLVVTWRPQSVGEPTAAFVSSQRASRTGGDHDGASDQGDA